MTMIPTAIPTPSTIQAEDRLELAFGGRHLLNDLLVAAGRHDQTAFAKFYELTSPWIYDLLLSRTGSQELAEDAVFRVYIAIWQQAATFVPLEKSALAWATLIAFDQVTP